eukprot:354664-Chlamydomonas_euryale.AAC.1
MGRGPEDKLWDSVHTGRELNECTHGWFAVTKGRGACSRLGVLSVSSVSTILAGGRGWMLLG